LSGAQQETEAPDEAYAVDLVEQYDPPKDESQPVDGTLPVDFPTDHEAAFDTESPPHESGHDHGEFLHLELKQSQPVDSLPAHGSFESTEACLSGLYTEFDDSERCRVCNFNATLLDGVFPAFRRAQFLPVKAETLEAGASADTCEVKDARVPKDLSVLPHRLVHVHDERGENFVIEYEAYVMSRWYFTQKGFHSM